MKRLQKIVGVRLGQDHLDFLEDAAQVAPSVWWRSRGFKPSDVLRKALNDFISGDGKERAEFLQEVVKQKKKIRNFRLTPGPGVKQSIGRKNVKRSAGKTLNSAGNVKRPAGVA